VGPADARLPSRPGIRARSGLRSPRYFQSYRESFNRTGTTAEKLQAAFEAERKKNPDLTAEQFLQGR
jgi:hypothetical protein